MLKHSLTVAIAIYCMTGCASSSQGTTKGLPEPVSSSPVFSEPPTRNTPTSRATWRINPVAEAEKYSSVLTTQIQQTGNSGKQDSLTVTTLYSVSIDRATDVTSLTGKIEAFTVQAGEQIGSSASEIQSPVFFSGKFTGQELELESLTSTNHTYSLTCDDVSLTSLATVYRNTFISPLEIFSGQTWQDSTSYTVCSGSLPLSVVSIRNYRLAGETILDGIPALIISQNEKTFSRGEGSQGQHKILVEARGTTTRRLYLYRNSGILLSSSADSKTMLSIRTSGRVENFVEISKENTTRQK